MLIRRAQKDEWPELARVFIAARGAMAFLPVLHTDEETRDFIRDVVAEAEVWVAATGDGIAGFAALTPDFLDHLYVAPDAQNAGAGSALLARTKERRPEGFSLWTFQANLGARRFYERHGLKVARLTDGADNEERLPDVLYVWPGAGPEA